MKNPPSINANRFATDDIKTDPPIGPHWPLTLISSNRRETMARKKTELRFIPIDKHIAYLYIDDNANLSFEEHKERERERETLPRHTKRFRKIRFERKTFLKIRKRSEWWKIET